MRTNQRFFSFRSGALLVRFGFALAIAIWTLDITSNVSAQTLVYSFELDEDGFGPNGGGISVAQDSIGATEGTGSLKVEVDSDATFVGALSTLLPIEIGDPPGMDFVLFDLTVTEEFGPPPPAESGFAVVGITMFGANQDFTVFGLAAQFKHEVPIDGLAVGTHTDMRIDLDAAHSHPLTSEADLSFNEIFGESGSGPDDVIPTGFQFFFNKTGSASDHLLTVYIDNVRVGMIQPVAGDYNEDGIVNAADYTFWRNRLGDTTALPNTDPTDVDGMVTDDEYTFWVSRYGATTGSLGAAAVPEPGALLMIILAGAIFLAGKRGGTLL